MNETEGTFDAACCSPARFRNGGLPTLLASCLLVCSCVGSNTVPCNDGIHCPPGMECDPVLGACVAPSQLAACQGRAEGATCSFPGDPTGSYTCQSGVCLPAPRCGDGKVNTAAEECDCGDTADRVPAECGGPNDDAEPDRCRVDCTAATCGDGVLDTGEGCDDGNLVSGDGCSDECQYDGCGDGIQAAPEDCDGSDLADRSCGELGYYGGTLGCNELCRFDTSACTGKCGDGVQNGTEPCDGQDLGGWGCQDLGYYDGTLTCSVICTLDDSTCGSHCGDGILDPSEECDATVLGGETCETLGYYAGTLGCNLACGFDVTGCSGRCGDGLINDVSEECDGGNLDSLTCEDLGYYGGDLDCYGNCRHNTEGCAGRCGDGIVNGDEVCDQADFDGLTCEDLGYYTGTPGCDPDCRFVVTGTCEQACGDWTRNGPELCDGPDLGFFDCQDFGYYGGTLACDGQCSGFDFSGCEGFCGDGIKNGPEQCDGRDQGGEYCTDFWGFVAGAMHCNAYCQRSFETCFVPSWERQDQITSSQLYTVAASSPERVLTVGYSGVAWLYDGIDWSDVDTSQTVSFTRAFVAEGGAAFAYHNQNPPMLQHHDGNGWLDITPPGVMYVLGFWAASATDAWAAVRTADGTDLILQYDGSEWAESWAADPADEIWALWGSGPSDVFAAGSVMLHYDGQSWQTMACSACNTVNDLWGSGSGDVYAAGYNWSSGTRKRQIFHFDGNPSLVWTEEVVATGSSSPQFWRIWGSARDDIYAMDETNSLLRYDGVAWSGYSSSMIQDLNRLGGTSPADRWYVQSGSLYHHRGENWQLDPGFLVLGTMGSSDSRTLWGSPSGSLFEGKYLYDGRQWHTMQTPTGCEVYRLHGTSESNVIAASQCYDGNVSEGVILHYDGNSSHLWTRMTADASEYFGPVWALSDTDGFTASAAGKILRRTGGHWTTVHDINPSVNDHSYLFGIWASSDSNVYFVGEDSDHNEPALILHYDGQSFQKMPNPAYGTVLTGIWGSDPTNLYAVGGSTILHFDGVAWRQAFQIENLNLTTVWGSSAQDVFVAGLGGQGGSDAVSIWHFDGSSWSPMDTQLSLTRRSHYTSMALWGRGAHDVYLGGTDNGLARLRAELSGLRGGVCGRVIPLHCTDSLFGNTAGQPARFDTYVGASRPVTGPEVVYRFDSPMTDDVSLRLVGQTADLDLIILSDTSDGGCASEMPVVATSQDPGVGLDAVTFPAAVGQRYYVVVDGYAGAESSFRLEALCPRPH